MAQFSMEIRPPTGSVPRENQQLTRHFPASEATTSGVLADLEGFGCIYAPQPNALAAEREGVAINDVRRGRGGDETESEQGRAVAKLHR